MHGNQARMCYGGHKRHGGWAVAQQVQLLHMRQSKLDQLCSIGSNRAEAGQRPEERCAPAVAVQVRLVRDSGHVHALLELAGPPVGADEAEAARAGVQRPRVTATQEVQV